MRAALLAALALALGACVSTRTAPATPADLARHADGRRATVVLHDGRAFPADALRLDADSVSWVDPATGALGQVAAAEVRGVRVRGSRAQGALDGLLRGALIGTAGGALFGVTYLAGADFCVSSCDYPGAAVAVGSVGGAVGAAGGLAVGALAGRSTLYTLPPRE